MSKSYGKKSRGPVVIAAVCVLALVPVGILCWIFFQDVSDLPPTKLAARSAIVAYATIDTNTSTPHLVVTDLWKQEKPGVIAIGRKLPLHWPPDGGPLPDGAVVFFEPTPSASGFQLKPSSQWYVRSGRVRDVTVQEFRAQCGL